MKYSEVYYGLRYVYEGSGDRLELVTIALNQEVLLSYWPIVVIMIGFEIALALYKLIIGQWTKRIAIFNTVLQLMGGIVFIVIVMNLYLYNQDFITYMTELFSFTEDQLKNWIAGGGIFLFLVSGAFNIFDGFSKASIRK